VIDLFADARLNHHTEAQGGVLADECGQVLRDFFAERRELFRRRRAAPGGGGDDAAAIPAGDAVEIDSDLPPL
jgi:tRNA(adenine34) deaminase